MFPHCERMTIVIRVSDKLTGVPQLHFSNDSGRVELIHPADFRFSNAKERQDYMKWIRDSLVQIVCRMLIIRDVSSWMEKVAGQQRGFSRALTLSDALTLDSNVFGAQQLRLIDWLEPENKSWAILRDRPWRVAKPISSAGTEELSESPKFGTGPLPADLLDRSRIKHTDRLVLSPIDIPLWDRAKWRGTLFGWLPDALPMLALAFMDGQAGQAIFRAWRERWGNEDKDDALRLSIIRGLSRLSPAEYAVVVGPNLRHVGKQEKKTFMFVSRINRMTPTSTANLDAFINAYQQAGTFLLAPAQFDTSTPTPFIQLAIAKRHIQIREAWEIEENDPDIFALHNDDQPIVPTGVIYPPVIRALEQIRAMRRDRIGEA